MGSIPVAGAKKGKQVLNVPVFLFALTTSSNSFPKCAHFGLGSHF